MSCCGSKRQGLNTFDPPTDKNTYENSEVKSNIIIAENTLQTEVTFRYTGYRSLEIKSITSKKLYHYSLDNPEITVPAEDVAMMRGYRDLIELKIT